MPGMTPRSSKDEVEVTYDRVGDNVLFKRDDDPQVYVLPVQRFFELTGVSPKIVRKPSSKPKKK